MGREVDEAGLTASFRTYVNIVSLLTYLLTYCVVRYSCCVDEVAAEHYNVDAVVHYGHACLSPTAGKLSVHYVLGRQPLHADESIAEATAAYITDDSRPVLLLYDTVYHHAVVSK